MERTEENLQDWMGATFFLQIYLGFSTMYRGVVHFPNERKVITKERQSGAYRLSSYFISKLIAEFPLDLFLPLFAATIFYWMVGLADDPFIFILYILVSALGIFVAKFKLSPSLSQIYSNPGVQWSQSHALPTAPRHHATTPPRHHAATPPPRPRHADPHTQTNTALLEPFWDVQ